jgi:hypothetical protein
LHQAVDQTAALLYKEKRDALPKQETLRAKILPHQELWYFLNNDRKGIRAGKSWLAALHKGKIRP